MVNRARPTIRCLCNSRCQWTSASRRIPRRKTTEAQFGRGTIRGSRRRLDWISSLNPVVPDYSDIDLELQARRTSAGPDNPAGDAALIINRSWSRQQRHRRAIASNKAGL